MSLSSIRNIIIVLFIAIVFAGFGFTLYMINSLTAIANTTPVTIRFDVRNDPIQKNVHFQQPVVMRDNGSVFKFDLKAEYKIAARIVSKKNYYSGWDGRLAPVDLALAWGKLVDPENLRNINYSQGNR